MPTSAALDRWGRLPDACRELQRGAALPLQTVHASTMKGAAMRSDFLCDCLLLLLHAQMQLPALRRQLVSCPRIASLASRIISPVKKGSQHLAAGCSCLPDIPPAACAWHDREHRGQHVERLPESGCYCLLLPGFVTLGPHQIEPVLSCPACL